MKKELATFAGGCFWGVEYYFSKIKGVASTRVGYIGGDEVECPNPTYEDVCSDETGYAEAIEITFDPKVVSYESLLDVFWTIHDPTTLNRQGPDVGTQYRSAIFYHSVEQKKIAEASRKKWEGKLIDKTKKIVTEIVPAKTFFPAEDYHQKYVMRTGRACHLPPKVFR